MATNISRLKRMSLSLRSGFKAQQDPKEKESLSPLRKEELSPDLPKKQKRRSTALMFHRLSGFGLTSSKKSELVEIEDSGAYVPDEFYKMLVCLQEHIQEEGIFRITGNQSKIQELKSHIGEDNINFRDYDPHVIAGVMKSILREMKVPLLTYEIYDWCLAIKDLGDDENLRKTYIRKILNMCPETNLQIMDDLFAFLSQVNLQSHINKMNAGNLSVIFAPCLLRARDENTSVSKMLDDAPVVTSIIETLILNYELFFNHDLNTSSSSCNLHGTVWKSTISSC